MDRAAARRVVAEWLEEGPAPALVARDLPPVALRLGDPILALVGPRRAGKTFHMFELIARLVDARVPREEILFVDFEDYRLTRLGPSSVDELLAAHQELAGRLPRYLFLDEVQNLPGWSRMLRTLHNSRRHALVVSGSNAGITSREVATELRGRTIDRLILPFSFREQLRLLGVDHGPRALATTAYGRVRGAFERYLQWGGFPEVARASEPRDKRALLQSYYHSVFYRDLLERFGIRARDLLEALMRSGLEEYASLFSISTFERQWKASGAQGSKRTIASYLSRLADAFFVVLHTKYDRSPRVRAMNPRKLYLIDTGLGELAGALSENRGRRLENVVAIELLRRGWTGHYHKGARECDLLVRDASRWVAAIQVTWELAPRNREREVKGLCDAMDAFGIDRGLILTFDQEETLVHEKRRIEVVPTWRWLLTEA